MDARDGKPSPAASYVFVAPNPGRKLMVACLFVSAVLIVVAGR